MNLVQLLEPSLLIKMQENSIDSGVAGLAITCPQCHSYREMVDTLEEFNHIYENPFQFACRNCDKTTCLRCLKMHPTEDPCQLTRRELVSHLQNLLSRHVIHSCPKCGRAYHRSEGCARMRCTQCETYFCYVCEAPIEGYEHFAAAVMAEEEVPEEEKKEEENKQEPKPPPKCNLFAKEEVIEQVKWDRALARAVERFGNDPLFYDVWQTELGMTPINDGADPSDAVPLPALPPSPLRPPPLRPRPPPRPDEPCLIM